MTDATFQGSTASYPPTTLVVSMGAGAVNASQTQRITLCSDDPAVTNIGALTETAPATDTASSGLNGRLQRIAQRITTLIGSTIAVSVADGSDTTLGAKADAKNSATDATAISGMSVWKQISSSVQAIATSIAGTVAVSGTFWQATQPVSLASVPSHAVTNAGTFAVQATEADGANTTLGSKADAKSTATDTTAITIMQVLKQISASSQLFVFGAGTAAAAERMTLASDDPAVATLGATSGAAVITDANGTIQQYLRGLIKQWIAGTLVIGTGANVIGGVTIADGSLTTLGAKADAKSTATDTTAVTVMQVLKQISASVQAPPSQAVTNAGTFPVQAAGDVASGSSDSGNPVKIGAVGHTAAPTAVTDGQRVNLIADKVGKLITVGAIRDLKGVTQTQLSNTTSETTIVAAVASTFLDLYGLILANTGASTTKVTIKDSTAGTTRAIIEVPTLETRGFMLPVDSAIPQATVNDNWTATCGTATTALEVTAMWIKNI